MMVTSKKYTSYNVPMFARRKSVLKTVNFKSCIKGLFCFFSFFIFILVFKFF